jgi:hypothetical protein
VGTGAGPKVLVTCDTVTPTATVPPEGVGARKTKGAIGAAAAGACFLRVAICFLSLIMHSLRLSDGSPGRLIVYSL